MAIKLKNILAFFSLAFFLLGCSNGAYILANKNFGDGNWLLVNKNSYKQTIRIITDKNILKENPFGIKIKSSKTDQYTTCDGSIKLYKDGELVAEQSYLDTSFLIESNAIKKSYKNGIDTLIYPTNKSNYKTIWDNLLKSGKNYPTRYHIQPEDKDIIFDYKFE